MIHQEIIDENKYGVSGGSRGGAQRARSSVILDEKRRNNRRNKSRESKQNKNGLPPTPLSSRSSPATGCYKRTVCTFIHVWHLLVRCPSKAVHWMSSLLSLRHNPSSKGVHTQIFVRHDPKVFHLNQRVPKHTKWIYYAPWKKGITFSNRFHFSKKNLTFLGIIYNQGCMFVFKFLKKYVCKVL